MHGGRDVAWGIQAQVTGAVGINRPGFIRHPHIPKLELKVSRPSFIVDRGRLDQMRGDKGLRYRWGLYEVPAESSAGVIIPSS
jgi:hypothetical protein